MPEPILPYAAPDTPAEPPKGALLSIFLIVLVDFLGFGLIIPLLPFYVENGQSHPMQVTFLFAIYSICQFIGAPILGAMSDRYGRRPVLVISQIGSAFGYALLGAASVGGFSPEKRLLLVYLSRIIDGFTGGNVSTAQAYISDVTTPQNRAKGMGLLGAAFGIGFCLGPFIGGVLGHYNKSWPAYAAAAFAAIAAFQTYFKLPESRIHKPTDSGLWLHPARFAPVFKKPAVGELLLISFVSMAAFVMMETTVGLFLEKHFGYKERQVGWFFAYVGFVIIIVQGGLIGRITKKYGEWLPAILGPLFVAAGMAFYIGSAYVPTLWILGAAGAVNAIGRSLQGPTLSSLLSQYSDASEQGIVFGLYHGLSSLARVFGPIIAGFTYPFLRNTGQYWTAGAMVLAATLWTIGVRAKSTGLTTAHDQTPDTQSQAHAATAEVE